MVIVIIGTLSAVALPKLAASITVRAIDSAARLVRSEMVDARNTAMMTSQPMLVEFDETGDTFRISSLDDGEVRSSTDLAGEPWGVDILLARFRASGLVAGGEPFFVYDIWGRPRDAAKSDFGDTGEATGTLQGGLVALARGERRIRIFLDPVTGEVRLEDLR